jgi:pimeloyl-ACP methyl ester carboxylesterase
MTMTATASTAGRQIEINGASLYVAEQGRGDPLILVHMGLGSSATWDQVAPLLAGDFRVITYDTRGFGHSSNPAGTLSYEQMADDAATLADALGLERPFIGGWSDGGHVALRFGLRHPGRARALVCGGTALEMGSERLLAQTRDWLHVGDDGAVDFPAFASGMVGQRLLPMMRQWHPGGEEHWQRVLQQSATMYLAYEGLTRDQFVRIAEPTLVIVGDRDDFVPVEEAVQLSQWLPSAELAILPGTSHIRPMFEPATFACAVIDFLRRH